MYRSFPANRAMKPLTSSRPWSESAASCSAAIHPSVRSSRTSTSLAVRSQSGRSVEVRGGLVGGEPQVGGPDLDQLAAHPPSSQRQIGVGAGAEHDVHVGREVVQQEGHALADLVVVRPGGSRRGPATPRPVRRPTR